MAEVEGIVQRIQQAAARLTTRRSLGGLWDTARQIESLAQELQQMLQPDTPESLEKRLARLLDDVEEIDRQLGEQRDLGPLERDMSEREYLDWRRRAHLSKNRKLREYRRLKQQRQTLLEARYQREREEAG